MIVEVGRRYGDYLDTDALFVHIRQPDIRVEDGLGQRAKPSPPRVAQIPGSVLGEETRSEIGMSPGHFGEGIGNDRMGVQVDCRQRRGPLTFAVSAGTMIRRSARGSCKMHRVGPTILGHEAG